MSKSSFITSRFIGTVVAVAVLPICLMTWSIWHARKNDLLALEQSRLQSSAIQTKLAIVGLLTEAEDYIRVLGSNLAVNGEPTNIGHTLDIARHSNRYFELLALYDEDGRLMANTESGNGNRSPTQEVLTTSAWFQKALEGYAMSTTADFDGSGKRGLLVTTCFPCKNRQTKHVLVGLLCEKNIQQALQASEETNGTTAFLYDSLDHVFYTSRSECADLLTYVAQEKAVDATAVGMTSSSARPSTDHPDDMTPSEFWSVTDTRNRSGICFTTPLTPSRFDTLGDWSVGVASFGTDISGRAMVPAIGFFLAAVVALALICCFAYKAFHRMEQMILQVIKAARAVNRGNLKVQLSTSLPSPLKELAESFNTQVVRLHDISEARKRLGKEIMMRNRFEHRLQREKEGAVRACKIKNEFVANLSHEIRTPLTSIIGYGETLLGEVRDPDSKKQISTLLNEADILLSLINDLLDNAKIDAGKITLERNTFELSSILQKISSEVAVEVQRKHLRFNICIDDQVPRYLVGDSLRLRQVLSNLTTNAVKFTRHGDISIDVETLNLEEKNATLRISVNDTGIGIEPDQLETIFNDYAQAEPSTTRLYGGTGLGTAISKKLIEIMGGRIGVESTPRVGSRFWLEITLPIGKTPKKESPILREGDGNTPPVGKDPTASVIAADQQAGSKGKPQFHGMVLVAEDYEINQDVIRLQLEKFGLQVTVVSDGRQAVEKARVQFFDLILMDINMPNMDGLEATREIRSSSSLCKNAPIIAMTANVDAESLKKCTAAGMTGALPKPTHYRDIQTLLKQWLPPATDSDPSIDHLQIKSDELAVRTPAVPKSADSGVPLNDPAAATDQAEADDSTIATDESAGQSSTDTFNFDAALAMFAGNRPLLLNALDRLSQSREEMVPIMREAQQRGDHETIRSVAHKLKGGASCVMATALAQAAETVEHLAEKGDSPQIAPLLESIDQRFSELEICLHEILEA